MSLEIKNRSISVWNDWLTSKKKKKRDIPHGIIFHPALASKILQRRHSPSNDMVILTPIVLEAPPRKTLHLGHLALQTKRDIRRLVEVRVIAVVRTIVVRLMATMLSVGGGAAVAGFRLGGL